MPASVKQFVRYWGYLLGKFLIAGGLLLAMLIAQNAWWPQPNGYDTRYLAYLVGEGVIFLMGVGLFYLAILDQRYRCRVCLRRLRMPVETGSWSRMLQMGRPKIEYICIYGHGRLNIPELQITGIETAEWTGHEGDYWAELCAAGAGDEPEDRSRPS